MKNKGFIFQKSIFFNNYLSFNLFIQVQTKQIFYKILLLFFSYHFHPYFLFLDLLRIKHNLKVFSYFL